MPKLSEFLFGRKEKTKPMSFQTEGQQNLMNQLLGQLGGQGGAGGNALSLLQSYLNPSQQSFEQFANPYMTQFNEQVLPGIAERFAGAGALSSSGFGQALGGAASGLQSQLAQLYSGRQQQSAQSILGLLQNLLGQQTFGYQQRQANPGFVAPLLGNAFEAAGKAYGLGG